MCIHTFICGGQKEALDTLEMELYRCELLNTGAGNQIAKNTLNH